MSNTKYINLNQNITDDSIIEMSNSQNSISTSTYDNTINHEFENSDVNRNLIAHKKERIYWIDCLRVFASILVVFVHCTVTDVLPLELKSNYWYSLFTLNCFSRSCVPLFIMISGIFFLNPYKEISIETIYKKYLWRIFKSFVFWSIYYNTFDRVVMNFYNETFVFNSDLIISMIRNSILGGSHLWYLTFVFGLYATTPLFREIARNRTVAWYTVILSFTITQIIPTICEIFEVFFYVTDQTVRSFINLTMPYAFYGYINYFMLGYLLGTTELKKKSHIYGTYIVGILGIVFTIILRIGSAIRFNQETHNFQEYNNFNIGMNTLGFFCFFKYTVNKWITPYMEEYKYKSILKLFSDCSFGVYLVHYSVYHFFFKIGLNSAVFHPILCAPVNTIIVYGVSFIITYYMRKVKIFKEIM